MSSKPDTDGAPAASDDPVRILTPTLPPARFVDLDDRGTIMVRDFGGRPGAPVVALLHGWTATADLNWFKCYEGLGERFRVVAFDQRRDEHARLLVGAQLDVIARA